MKFAYTIWQNPNHFENISEVVNVTKDVADCYIITTFPQIQNDNVPIFTSSGLRQNIEKAIDVCKNAGKQVVLQSIPTPMDSRGKTPDWWQGWVYFDSSSDWRTFFRSFSENSELHIELGEELGADAYLIGAELTATLGRTSDWKAMIKSLKSMTTKPIGYSHHFSLPLKYYYRWELFFAVMFGWFWRREKVYGDLLKTLLGNQFHVPKNQLIRTGKSLYQTANVNMADLDFIKLNDYFWYVMDKAYTEKELRTRWEYVLESGTSIKFMPAVRSWVQKYIGSKELWIENDLNMGFVDANDEYYEMWWRVFLAKHQFADVIIVWDASHDYTRWARTIKKIIS
jgi:hypothetical protein